MLWARRGNKRYFSRSVRVNGRPTRQYLGSGPEAQAVAASIALARQIRSLERDRARADDKAAAEATEPLDRLCELTDILVRAALLDAGFHQHDRGDWRKRRAFNRITDGRN